MFQWYRNASRCYVFLSDVLVNVKDGKSLKSRHKLLLKPSKGFKEGRTLDKSVEASFRASRWFQRGWTLQELIAAPSVEFFSKEGKRLGSKRSLEKLIHNITRIPVEALQGNPLDDFSVQQRMAWMQGRETTEPEDMAYSLIGIFNVLMDFRYGEGMDKAVRRLGEAIERGRFHALISSSGN